MQKSQKRNILESVSEYIFQMYYVQIPIIFLHLFLEKRFKDVEIPTSISIYEEADETVQILGLGADIKICLNRNGILDFQIRGEESFSVQCKNPEKVKITGLNPNTNTDTDFCRSFIGKVGYLLIDEKRTLLIHTEDLVSLDAFYFAYETVEGFKIEEVQKIVKQKRLI